MNAITTELKQVDARSLIEARFSLQWQSALGRHSDTYHFPKLNVWRDIDLLPSEIQSEILGRPEGHRGHRDFAPGQLVPAWSEANRLRVHNRQFNRNWRPGMEVEPRLGRYYPRSIITGESSIFRGDLRPARLVEIDGDQLGFDCNHPLARHAVALEVEIGAIHAAGEEHGGRCIDLLEEMANGPGMQARCRPDQATEFLFDDPFKRLDGSDDNYFYSMPRLLNHLDRTALAQVQALYGRLLQPGTEILDLMSSVNSHLPDALLPARVTGLGMNEEELEANPVLSERLAHDLNQTPQLPFPDAAFDAVVCTVSVEYLTQPLAVFREVARVLRPGGRFVVTLSNRWFPPKAIDLWHNLHEFERPALVLEYFLESGAFSGLETLSVRGLSRPEDDPHSASSPYSDPIHAIWGQRL